MRFPSLQFATPHWLWLSAGCAILVALLFLRSAGARRRQLAEFADPSRRDALLASHSRARRVVKNATLFAALLLLGIALARPQWGEFEEQVERKGDDVVFLIDTSQSMLAADVAPNRLERAKMAILDFLRSHAGGRVGLVAFAGDAFLKCPLTLDYDAFEESVRELDTNAVLVPGTDIASALFAGRSSFEKTGRRKVLVLLTDGEDLQHVGIDAAKKIMTEGVMVFTVGVGTPNGAIVRVPQPDGEFSPLLDEKDQPVTSRLDENTLRSIAEATGGTYRRMENISGCMTDVQRALKDSHLNPVAGVKRRHGIDRYQWPLAIAILLLVVESVLRTRRRMTPQTA